MYIHMFMLITGLKVLFIPLYHSTDFEVHRNWLAITHSLPLKDWYYENTSEWTLDYPPLFGYFEWLLSNIAKYVDKNMVQLTSLNYASNSTVMFQRLSVMVADGIYAFGVKRCTDLLNSNAEKVITFGFMIANPALLMIDHIHFQYNGFLFGILLLSIGDMMRGRPLMSAFWFTLLLNLKHIFLYIAPAYFVYLLRTFCFITPAKDASRPAWHSFSFRRLSQLAIVVTSVFFVTFFPFLNHIPQVVSRLFPFKRGLTHAYWAPNFWALYNLADKMLIVLSKMLGLKTIETQAAMSGGLVQDISHSVLPSIRPLTTFVLTAASMLPALVKLWFLCEDKNKRSFYFLRCLVICGTCSFMFGWHVHEKAILLPLIPLSFMAAMDVQEGKRFILLSTIASYSLFPLLYESNLLFIKVSMAFVYCACLIAYIPSVNTAKYIKNRLIYLNLKHLNAFECFSIILIWFVLLYTDFLHLYLGNDKKFPFLPLLITSCYCALNVCYIWLSYYLNFMLTSKDQNCIKNKSI